MRSIALFLSVMLLLGCQTLQVGSSSCSGLEESDCQAAEGTAKLAAPSGNGPIASIDIERNWDGCFLILCDRVWATVRITYWNTADVVIVHVERDTILGSMEATSVEVTQGTL